MQSARWLPSANVALVLVACGASTPQEALNPPAEEASPAEETSSPAPPPVVVEEAQVSAQPDESQQRQAQTEPEESTTPTVEAAASNDECGGSHTDDLLTSLRERGASSRGCFSALLKRGTEAKGQVKVALEIDAQGAVQGFDLKGDDPGDIEFTECLAEHFKVSFSATPPEGGCVVVKIPLNFSVKKSSS